MNPPTSAAQCIERGGPIPANDLEDRVPLDFNSIPDIRYIELLTSNEPPLDGEASSVHPIISRLYRRLSRQDDKISRLRTQLERLEQERATVEAEFLRNIAILSPLRRVPAEILSEIFTSTLLPDRKVMGRCNIGLGDSPWVLTHVCGRWRTVALASSSLWSFVGIDYSKRDLYPLPLLQAQLQRASRIRVEFMLHVPFSSDRTISENHLALFQLLVDHSPRWEELRLCVIPEIIPMITTLRDRIPVLRKLYLEWPSSDSGGTNAMDYFSRAPALRHIALMLNSRTLSVPLPAHQLTRYQINCSWERHMEMLQVAKNLTEAHITVCGSATPRIVPGGVIELRYLRRLYVSDVDILDSLRLPALDDFGFFQDEFGTDPSPHIDSVTARSSCVLRRLCVFGSADGEIIASVLQKHHGILELAVADITAGFDDDFSGIDPLISKLAERNSNGIFAIAPQLAAIFFGFQYRSCPVNYELWHDMLRARWETGALKTASLLNRYRSKQPPSSIRGRLQDLQVEGLNLLCLDGNDAIEAMTDWILDPWILPIMFFDEGSDF
ncbi:hypothetical protein K438DRAFT_650423 [Mycena galopus ATCC 62051]|nr:hypothetical protein K438DRAFT_650423 [Mycena galopus ATCC 62051]